MNEQSEIRGIQAIHPQETGMKGALETIFIYYGNKDPQYDESQDIERLASQNGFKTELLPPGFDAIRDNVAMGTPILVKYTENKQLHYGVVTGWDKENLKIADRGWMNARDFEVMWDKKSYTILPSDKEFQKEHEFKKIVTKERRSKENI